jgi:hypothetical protein
MSQARAGERLARALAGSDRIGLLGLLAPQLNFRALTPGGLFEASSAMEAADIMLGTWFGGNRRIDAIERIETDTVADRERVGYRFRATTENGDTLVEQQAYLEVDDGVITSLRVLCTGFRPVTPDGSPSPGGVRAEGASA